LIPAVDIAAPVPVAAGSSGSFLVSPALGLMIWTLIVFGVTMWVLSKAALPRIGEALDRRARAIRENIEAAEKQRQAADELLEEYRQRLKEAREQADEIVARARQAADTHEGEAKARGQEMLAEAAKRAERDIDSASKRALDDIRREVADLTILATEKVTRKSLDDADQRRLVEQALAELDFSAIASPHEGASQN